MHGGRGINEPLKVTHNVVELFFIFLFFFFFFFSSSYHGEYSKSHMINIGHPTTTSLMHVVPLCGYYIVWIMDDL